MGFQMPKPNDTHAKLAKHAGSWVGVETLYPSDWDPNGGTAEATLESRVDLDGFAVIGDYVQKRDGRVSFRGHAVWTVDPGSGEILLTWFDSLGFLPETFRGKFEGDRLVVVSQTHQGLNRLTYSHPKSGEMTSSMETSPDGETWSKMFDGRYTRRG